MKNFFEWMEDYNSHRGRDPFDSDLWNQNEPKTDNQQDVKNVAESVAKKYGGKVSHEPKMIGQNSFSRIYFQNNKHGGDSYITIYKDGDNILADVSHYQGDGVRDPNNIGWQGVDRTPFVRKKMSVQELQNHLDKHI